MTHEEGSPVGVPPRYIWLEKRANDLARAIYEYSVWHSQFDDRLRLLRQWTDELQGILAELAARKEQESKP